MTSTLIGETINFWAEPCHLGAASGTLVETKGEGKPVIGAISLSNSHFLEGFETFLRQEIRETTSFNRDAML